MPLQLIYFICSSLYFSIPFLVPLFLVTHLFVLFLSVIFTSLLFFFFLKIPYISDKKAMATHPNTGKSHGWRSLVGCSPWGRQESDKTERLHFHFSLSCIGEGNGNPVQCSCLENPRDWGACWAAICGVAQSQTRLKQLSI